MNDDLHLLMRYHDSEVEPPERALVAAMLLRDTEQRSLLHAWRAVGDAIRGAVRSPSEDADLIEQLVMSRIASVDAAARLPRRPERWRVAATLACAAGFLLAIGYEAGPQGSSSPRHDPAVVALERTEVAPAAPIGGSRVEGGSRGGQPNPAIERVDLGGRSGAIFLVSVGDMETPVVWLNDEGQRGRIRNL